MTGDLVAILTFFIPAAVGLTIILVADHRAYRVVPAERSRWTATHELQRAAKALLAAGCDRDWCERFAFLDHPDLTARMPSLEEMRREVDDPDPPETGDFVGRVVRVGGTNGRHAADLFRDGEPVDIHLVPDDLGVPRQRVPARWGATCVITVARTGTYRCLEFYGPTGTLLAATGVLNDRLTSACLVAGDSLMLHPRFTLTDTPANTRLHRPLTVESQDEYEAWLDTKGVPRLPWLEGPA